MNVLNNFEVLESAMYDSWLNVQRRYMLNPPPLWYNSLSQNNLKINANTNALFCQIILMPMHYFYKLANTSANANAPNQF